MFSVKHAAFFENAKNLGMWAEDAEIAWDQLEKKWEWVREVLKDVCQLQKEKDQLLAAIDHTKLEEFGKNCCKLSERHRRLYGLVNNRDIVAETQGRREHPLWNSALDQIAVIVSDSLAELTKAWERVDPRRKIAGELTALRLAAYSLKDSKIVTADDIDIVSANVTDILDRILQFGQEHPECDGALDQIADIVQDFYDHVCQNRGECTVQLPGRSV
eukprot:GHVQ01011260.1.p1 GENE.GHVQ01011260.1~~GHVQ01011260.1.p1  ORF type:complete len:217 (-),score=18.56 GHVQ01011260.1:442-1092(-)